MRKVALLTVASWEDRFILGFKKTLEEYADSSIQPIVFFFKEYYKWSQTNIDNARSLINFDKHELL